MHSYVRTALIALLVFAGCYIGTLVALELRFPSLRISVIWPPSAILLAALLLTPARTWWVWLLAALAAHFFGTTVRGTSVSTFAIYYLGNALEAVIAAFGVRRFSDSPRRLDTLWSAAVLIGFAGIITPGVTSFLVAFLLTGSGWTADYWLIWLARFLADALSIVTLTPLVLLTATGGIVTARGLPQRYAEFGLLLICMFSVGIPVFGWAIAGPGRYPALLYAPLPLLLWAAVRFGVGGVCLSLLLVALLSLAYAIAGYGPFVTQSPVENALALQSFLLAISYPLILLAALIEERRAKEEALWESEDRFRTMANSAPVMIWMSGPDKLCTFFNEGWLDFTGRNIRQELGNRWSEGVHPEDFDRCIEIYTNTFDARQEFTMEYRLRRHDGEYCWILDTGVPRFAPDGIFLGYIGSAIDITDRKRAEEELRRSAFYLNEGQRLAHSGSWSFFPSGIFEYLSQELYQIFGFDPAKGVHTVADYLNIVQPEDREFVEETINRMIAEGIGCDVKNRIIPRPDGKLRVIRCVGTPVRENGVVTRFIGTLMDITEQERMTQELRRKEAYLAEAQRLSQTGSFGWSVSSGEIFWSEETFRIFEYDRTTKPTVELVLQRVHPEDKTLVQDLIDRASRDGKDFDFEHRLLMSDGSIKYLRVVAHAIRDELDQIEFVGAVTDISATKSAEQRIQQDERELRQLIDFIPQHILVALPDGTRLYANQETLEYHGMNLKEVQADDFYAKVLHPDDLRRVLNERQGGISAGASWEAEARLLRRDGQYRWFLIRSNPLRNEQGTILRRYTTATDIEDRKQAEQKVQRENIALREEIDKASMFEEIVGSSEALRKVLSQVAKVAPTDSTVLIIGETGTGKELVARAIHKRSARSARAFVSVNCAAIPQSLIASELFGHEKGAFTGALQRRLGRFELAEGGTIFLDEIGDLPSDTQNTLLRVLQEREFERVGGTETIRADVRVIAATYRDLEAAIATGAFRSDLFYRLNVFPIEIPPVRERKEDIPMLVEYFIDRYASKLGKRIQSINKPSLQLLQCYSWPGNIRELQNVIERAVIVCESDNLVVDENWLARSVVKTPQPSRALSEELVDREKERIEAALAETQGRVSGPSGAAAKLGIPRSTLDSKIRSLKINTHRFKSL